MTDKEPDPERIHDVPDGFNAEDFATPLSVGASSLHELYQSYMAAGFNEKQALFIVVCAVAGIRLEPPAA